MKQSTLYRLIITLCAISMMSNVAIASGEVYDTSALFTQDTNATTGSQLAWDGIRVYWINEGATQIEFDLTQGGDRQIIDYTPQVANARGIGANNDLIFLIDQTSSEVEVYGMANQTHVQSCPTPSQIADPRGIEVAYNNSLDHVYMGDDTTDSIFRYRYDGDNCFTYDNFNITNIDVDIGTSSTLAIPSVTDKYIYVTTLFDDDIAIYNLDGTLHNLQIAPSFYTVTHLGQAVNVSTNGTTTFMFHNLDSDRIEAYDVNVTEDVDVTAPVITVTSPVNGSTVNDQPNVNISISVTEASTCQLANASDILDSADITTTGQLQLPVADGVTQTQDLTISCSDNTPLNNTGVSNLQLFVDSENPIVTITQPTNNSITNSDIDVSIICSDINIMNGNYTFSNSTNIIQTFNNATPNNMLITIDDTISVGSLGEGDYDLAVHCMNGINFQDAVHTVTVDAINPVASGTVISNSTPNEPDAIQVNNTCTDGLALSSYTVYNNESGTFTSVETGSLTGFTDQIVHNNNAIGQTVGFIFTCTDSAGNEINSSTVTYTGTPLVVTPLGVGDEITAVVGVAGQFVLSLILIILIVGGLIARFRPRGK